MVVRRNAEAKLHIALISKQYLRAELSDLENVAAARRPSMVPRTNVSARADLRAMIPNEARNSMVQHRGRDLEPNEQNRRRQRRAYTRVGACANESLQPRLQMRMRELTHRERILGGCRRADTARTLLPVIPRRKEDKKVRVVVHVLVRLPSFTTSTKIHGGKNTYVHM